MSKDMHPTQSHHHIYQLLYKNIREKNDIYAQTIDQFTRSTRAIIILPYHLTSLYFNDMLCRRINHFN
jgi:hypothetical protein